VGNKSGADRAESASDEFITRLLDMAEKERAQLVSILHDDLGGLMVAASIDLAWVEKNAPELSTEAQAKLKRSADSVRRAIDLKRQMIEDLRPTLLDNFGLFAALRWHVKHISRRSGVQILESYHDPEPKFNSEAATALFRIAQAALTLISDHEALTAASLTVSVDKHQVELHISDDARVSDPDRLADAKTDSVLAMKHRVRSLGGEMHIAPSSSGGTSIRVTIPKDRALTEGV
jgi:signal transduction histidine kinase